MTQPDIEVPGQRAKGDTFTRRKAHLHDADMDLLQILPVPFLNENSSESTPPLGPVLIETHWNNQAKERDGIHGCHSCFHGAEKLGA
jgi:hypothetical protein